MLGDPDPDPGGSRPDLNAPSPQELSDLKEQNEQQLVLIAQLKEMLRKEQSTVSQEKVEEYVNTLNRNKAKRTFRQKRDGLGTSDSTTSSSVGIDASKKERINLLRQQMEENKARLAERGKSQRGIEEMVTQLQAQLKDSQTLISSTPLNLSNVENKPLDYNESTPQKDLYNILLTKEKKITELVNKSQKLEGTILDLQENLKEKDSVIDARTKAITLMTDSLSKKRKNTLDDLEETKDQMRKMQENFVTLEAEMKARQLSLLNDLKIKNFEISDLQEANSQLEKDRLALEIKLSDTERSEVLIVPSENNELDQLREELEKLKIETQSQRNSDLEAKSVDNSIISDLQNELKESHQQNVNNLSKISQLEMQLEEVQSKLKIEENSGIDLAQSKLDSLEKQKNKLIDENQILSKDNSHYLTRISDLEKQLENTLTDLKLLKNTGMGGDVKMAQKENEEIVKLKKQLDESNKSKIKSQATQKGKIKELNKKLDQFKKMNDANALIGQLQNEISKLNEKVAELEDEKGNLQLKMVESTSSSKGDPTELEEHIKELEEKLSKTTEQLEENNKVIEILESEVLSLKACLKQKDEEEVKVSTQVSSEMSSINYEEQIEKIENEKKILIEELELINAEKVDLLKEIENVKKEKQDIAAKLDNYIQENMDLIDKLEKLSAEKVSSAESIEIVEGLTQQEKLELAAYQKHINPEEPLKCPDEDIMDSPAELNESVLQLGEDTVELLQKIEMFTQERKEVMQKMEALKEENNSLNLKVNEIENNRDILEETYEQLQNEKEVLTHEKQELLKKLELAQDVQAAEKEEDQSAEYLNSVLNELQIKCETLMDENDNLKRTLKEFNSKIQEKYDLEIRLREMVDNNSLLETKLSSNRDEINTYELTISENKNELIRSSELINELQSKLEDREKDIVELHVNLNDLNIVINELENKNSCYEVMESELQNLKSTLADQITQASDYESEMAQSNETMHTLQNELVQLNRRILELENELELKDSEIQKLNKDISNKDEIIRNLQNEIQGKDQKFKTVSEEIKGKYLHLQKQLDDNGDSLRKQIDDLTGKNKEQLERMKKIAANLKKKSQAYELLENQYKSDKEKWENETSEKGKIVHDLQETVVSLTKELEYIEDKLKTKGEENVLIQTDVTFLKEKVDILEQNNASQQHYIQELKHKQDKLQEISLQQEISASLHEEIDNSFPKNVPEEKIRELELLLETNEFELNHSKERIDKLEEIIRQSEEEKSVVENRNAELLEKLELTSNSFKEKALLEDQLELRLAEVSANDESLTKKLQETQKQHDELHKKNKEYEDLIKKLKVKLKKAHDKVTELKSAQTNLQELETVNQELKNQVTTLEANQRHIQNENETLQKRNMSDYEKIEADYQIQLEELLKTKNDLTVENEKLLEKLKELDDKEQELMMELDEYKLRLEQSENSHIEEINRLNEEILIIKGELEITIEQGNAENNRLCTEGKETHEKLQQALIEVDRLNTELEHTKVQLVTFGEQQQHLETSLLENRELSEKLRYADEKIENISVESGIFKQELEALNQKLQASLQDNNSLKSEVNKLTQEIQTLTVKAAYKPALTHESNFSQLCHQTEFLHDSQQTQETIPTFHWPNQQQTTEVLFDTFNPSQNLGESQEDSHQVNNTFLQNPNNEISQSALDSLKQQLNYSHVQLQSALQEAAYLRTESDLLKQEIQALQFAKTSLEASFESSQKLNLEKSLESSQSIVLEESPQKHIKQSQVLSVQPSVSLFEAFAQPNNDSIFDSLNAPSSGDSEWFNQQPSQPLSLPIHPNRPEDMSIDSNIPSTSFQPRAFSPVIEDGREALLKKIKALEFLLYNIDKEKEIALEQCTEMVNELTQVIYDQANAPQPDKKPISDLDSQIMSQEDIDNFSLNRRALRQTEYAKTTKESEENLIPVDEELIEPKKAYLCFDDEDLPKKPDQGSGVTESQVISEKDITAAASNKKLLQNIEYERVDKSLGEQQQPVVEPVAQPKQAYLCYTKEDKPQSFDAFEENDDGWGWGPEEARLEEEHMSNVENTPQVKILLLEIHQLKENMRVLQVERENHLEEIKHLQVKSGKLIKKCKELKNKNNQASTSKKQDTGGFFDLDEAIQEELKAQVQQLEKRIKEVTSDLEKDKLEKSGLLKRVDVLTAANDRMMEMKEIQDSEVLRWQRKHQEAVKKMQEFEWSSDGFGANKNKVTDDLQPSVSGSGDQDIRIQELENTIKDLTLDNEELQTLLEEQTGRRIEAEKNKSSGSDQEVLALRSLNDTLHKELDNLKLNDVKVQLQLTTVEQEKNLLLEEKAHLQKALQDKIQLLEEIRNNNEQQNAYNELQNEIVSLRDLVSNQEGNLHEKDLIIGDLQNNFDQLNTRKLELDQKVSQLTNDLSIKNEMFNQNDDTYLMRVNSLELQIEQLKSTVNKKEKAIDDLNSLIDNLQEEKRSREEVITQLKTEISRNNEMLAAVTAEKEKRDLEYQHVLKELENNTSQMEEYQKIITSFQEQVKETELFAAEDGKKDLENQNLLQELESKSLEIEEKSRQLEELKIKLSDSSQSLANMQQLSEDLNNKTKQIEELTAERLEKDKEIQQLLIDLQNNEQEVQTRTDTLVNEINENWQLQVDQRGADIAESWKMHLEMVEKDYTVVQEKLKSDIVELEEKLKILANENNELRNNVDQEIRNEVDKLSALQQQISNQQQIINSLNIAIQEKDKQIEEIQNNLSIYMDLENEIDALKTANSEKENKLASINIIIETTQKQFDEKREVIEEIVSILEKNASSPISYEKEDILKEFKKQLGSESEKDIEISQLNQYNKELSEKMNRILGENNREITGLNQVIEDLEKELSVIHEKEADIVRITTELNNLQLKNDELEQKITKINQEKDNLVPEYEKLKQEHLNCQAVVQDCQQKVQDYHNTNKTLQQILDERNREVSELNQKILQLQEEAGNDNNKEVERLTADMSKAKQENTALQETLITCQKELYEATQKLAQKSQELENANQNIYYYQENYTSCDNEINRLKIILDQREKEYSESLEMLKNNQMVDIQRHYEELLSNKELDNQTLQTQVQELIRNNQECSQRLNHELTLQQQLEQKLGEQTQLVDEDTKQLEELKLIIEDQHAQIEELKRELFDKSNQYDSLIAEMDLGRQPVTQQPIASTILNSLEIAQKQKYADDDLAEPVSRAELDLALYMLHQRDVRCEELTVELTQLLEERDTLQLRLSNSIREKEDLRRTINDNSPVPTTSSDKENTASRSKSSAIFLAASGTELAKDPLESEHSLATKLSELKIVGYKKDKTFVDEQDARRLQQLAIMQQHINEASKLPPEAAARLVDASYTLSRDVQSPSKVLLNWLWGKNPPKANDS